MTKKVKYGLLLVSLIGAFSLGRMGDSEKEVLVKETVKYKTIDRVITKPDGTKIVEIIKEVDKSKDSSTKVRSIAKNHIVGVSAGCKSFLRCEPIYALSYSRKAFLGLYVGLYVRSDRELGLTLSYSF